MKRIKSVLRLPFPDFILTDPKLKPVDRLLIAIITVFDNENGCFASNTKLAKLANISNPTLISSIKHLKKLGYIKSDRKRKGSSNIRHVCSDLLRAKNFKTKPK